MLLGVKVTCSDDKINYLLVMQTSILKDILEDDPQRSKARILIVDDDPDITLTFRIGLERNGFAITVFNDPIKALSSYRAGLYDLLLLDVRMPGMNGFELYREIEKVDNPKVCFITAFVVYYESLAENFPDVRIFCFIRKPIEIGKLVDRINTELNS
jgi:two-component system, OmpR family, response regulator ChvI